MSISFNRPVIDGHVHIEEWVNQDGKTFIEEARSYIAQYGLKSFCVASYPIVTKDVSDNIMCAILKAEIPEIYAFGGLLYPEVPIETLDGNFDPVAQYNDLMEIGFDGIKMLDMKPDYRKALGKGIEDPMFDGFFDILERNGTPVLIHSGDPDTFWDINRVSKYCLERGWFYGDGTFKPYEYFHNAIEKRLDRNPNLNVTMAHFFFLSEDPAKLETFFAKYPNFAVDLTPGTEMYGAFGKNRDFYRDFFIRHADRILYGTDSRVPMISPMFARIEHPYEFLTTDEHLEAWKLQFQGIALPDEAANKILCQNFLRRVSQVPKPINKKALKRYIETYAYLIKDDERKPQILEYAKKVL